MNIRRAFAHDGHASVEAVIGEKTLRAIERCLGAVAAQRAGTRQLLGNAWGRALAQRLRRHPALCGLLPKDAIAVQCTLFDKSAACNWSVPLHRDVHVPVGQRIAHPRLRGWSRKEGSWFVEAPPSLLSRLVAVRVHLDAGVPLGGALRVVPGSHRGSGRPAQAHECVLGRGDALVMRPLLLHASSRMTVPVRRRVLHFLFGPRELPFGLHWSQSA